MVGFYDLMSLSFSFLLLSYACLKQLNCTIQYLSVNSIPLLIFGKPHTNTINAVPLIRWRLESLPLKHMAQVSATTSAYDFSAQHTRWSILVPSYCSRESIKIRWPSTSRVKFMFCFVKWRGAPCTSIQTWRRIVLVVFPRTRCLSTLLTKNSKLFRCQNSLPLLLTFFHGKRFWGHLSGRGAGARTGTGTEKLTQERRGCHACCLERSGLMIMPQWQLADRLYGEATAFISGSEDSEETSTAERAGWATVMYQRQDSSWR